MTRRTYTEKGKSFPPEERSQAQVPQRINRSDDYSVKESVANNKNRSNIYVVTEEGKQELRSPFADSDHHIKNDAAEKYKKSDEVWTTAAIKDELTFQLSSSCSFNIDEKRQAIRITHKYYDQAEFVLYRLNLYKPPAVFIINRSDLTPKLQNELEQQYKSCPNTFDRLVTEAVQAILESINQRYYHVSSIAYKVCWRFEP
jgi:hypothetical protein